jgi:hypothetical protein
VILLSQPTRTPLGIGIIRRSSASASTRASRSNTLRHTQQAPVAQHHLDHRGELRRTVKVAAPGRNRHRHKPRLLIGGRRQRPAAPLPAPQAKQIGVNIVPARNLGYNRLGRQALLDHPQLIGRSPTPPPFGTGMNRNRRLLPIDSQINGHTISRPMPPHEAVLAGLTGRILLIVGVDATSRKQGALEK